MIGKQASKVSLSRMGASERDVLCVRELVDLPLALRWCEWMLRVKAAMFTSAEPLILETLARVVGTDRSIDLLIDDLQAELHDRPCEIVAVAGGWQHRSHSAYDP